MRLLGGQHLSDITFIPAAAEGTLHAEERICVQGSWASLKKNVCRGLVAPIWLCFSHFSDVSGNI